MWITQHKGEQVSVLMVHGAAPDDIYRRYRLAQPPRYAKSISHLRPAASFQARLEG